MAGVGNIDDNFFGFSGHGEGVVGCPLWYLSLNCGDFSMYDMPGSMFTGRVYAPSGGNSGNPFPSNTSDELSLYIGTPIGSVIGPSANSPSLSSRKLFFVECKDSDGGVTRHEPEFIGVYNGYPVYHLVGLGYCFRSCARKDRLVVCRDLEEPVAYAIAEYDRNTGSEADGYSMEFASRIRGAEWRESADKKWPCLGSWIRFSEMGTFLNDDKDDGFSLRVAAVLWRGDGCMGIENHGVTDVSNLPGSVSVGLWGWRFDIDATRHKTFFLQPDVCGYPESTKRNVVYTPSGVISAVTVPGGMGRAERHIWVFARDDCGAWLVNLDSSGTYGLEHHVSEGAPLYAEYVPNERVRDILGLGDSDEFPDCSADMAVSGRKNIRLTWIGHKVSFRVGTDSSSATGVYQV